MSPVNLKPAHGPRDLSLKAGKHRGQVMRHKGLRWAVMSALLALIHPVPTTASAQDVAVAHENPGHTRLLLLGTAGGPPLRKGRSEPASLLIVDGRPYLFDCGLGTVRQLLNADIRPESVRTLFITHNHPDHELDLSALIANDVFVSGWLKGQSWKIYGPSGTQQLGEAALHYADAAFGAFAREGLTSSPDHSAFGFHDVADHGLIYQDDKIRVYAAENSHYALMSKAGPNPPQSLSYRVETPDAVVVFTGDTGPSEALARLATNADVLVSEVIDLNAMRKLLAASGTGSVQQGHLSALRLAHMEIEHLDIPEVGKLATAAHVGAVVLNHLGPEADLEPADVYVRGVSQGFAGPVVMGSDLALFCVASRRVDDPAAKTLSPC